MFSSSSIMVNIAPCLQGLLSFSHQKVIFGLVGIYEFCISGGIPVQWTHSSFLKSCSFSSHLLEKPAKYVYGIFILSHKFGNLCSWNFIVPKLTNNRTATRCHFKIHYHMYHPFYLLQIFTFSIQIKFHRSNFFS